MGRSQSKGNFQNTNHPQKVTAWCALFAGGIIGPYLFENYAGNQVVVNSERYCAMLNNFLRPILEENDMPTAIARMALLQEEFPGCIFSHNSEVRYPLRTCDLMPLDSFLSCYLKS